MKEKAYFYAKNLIQKFDSMEVNASFECEKASMTSIVGSSGSGKSTLLRLICGLNKADPKQELFLDGIDINKLPPSKRQTGLVFQSNCLFNHLTVEDNVAYGLISNGVKRKDARKEACDFLKYFELEGFEKRYPERRCGPAHPSKVVYSMRSGETGPPLSSVQAAPPLLSACTIFP